MRPERLSDTVAPEVELCVELDLARKRIRELENANAELTQFAYVLCHDLQSPVRKIMGFCDVLRERTPDGEAKTLADTVVRAAKRLSGLVDSMLSLARVSSEPAPLANVRLDEVFDEALEELAPAIAASGACVIRAPLPAARGDRVQLGQLARNLLGNALKYRAEDRPLQIRVGAMRAEDGRVAFFVEDNGEGVKPADRAKLFRPFFRAESARRVDGYGLGLALCRRIARRHGGDVRLDPNCEAGCRFLVELAEEGL